MKNINFKRCFPHPLSYRDSKIFRVLQEGTSMINPGIAISLSDLMKKSRLSRPSVIAAIKKLEELCVLKILPQIYKAGPRQYIMNPPNSWLISAATWVPGFERQRHMQ